MTHRALDCFWTATGSTPPLHLLVWPQTRSKPVEHLLDRPFAIIGRTPPADLVLDHPQISRRHAFLQVVGNRVYCHDLGSRTALAWNGRSRRSGWIEPGQLVEIGPYRIGLASHIRPLTAIGTSRPHAGASSRFLLEPTGDIGPLRRQYTINRPFTVVGRAPETDLKLGDLSISRYHCILIRLGAELWVVDLLGRGGVEVNAQPVQWSRLDDGSLLRLGRYLFTVRSAIAPAPSTSPGALAHAPTAPTTPAQRPALLQHLPALIERPGLPSLTHPSLPPALEGTEHAELARVAESMIAPLIDQFTLMQQHLFDQYHHSMMEMMAVFTRLHHEQQGLVNRELRRIRRLTKEVRTLRRELDQHRAAEARSHASRNGTKLSADSDPIPTALRSGSHGTPEDYRAAQARIIARMTELQQERQGRWQRLLGRLGASSTEDDRSRT